MTSFRELYISNSQLSQLQNEVAVGGRGPSCNGRREIETSNFKIAEVQMFDVDQAASKSKGNFYLCGRSKLALGK